MNLEVSTKTGPKTASMRAAKNIVPLKTCIVHKTFQAFMLKCVNWLSKTCFVKVKINLDIILSEITFDNGVVKRWVAYFLKFYVNAYQMYFTQGCKFCICINCTPWVNQRMWKGLLSFQIYLQESIRSISLTFECTIQLNRLRHFCRKPLIYHSFLLKLLQSN